MLLAKIVCTRRGGFDGDKVGEIGDCSVIWILSQGSQGRDNRGPHIAGYLQRVLVLLSAASIEGHSQLASNYFLDNWVGMFIDNRAQQFIRDRFRLSTQETSQHRVGTVVFGVVLHKEWFVGAADI